MLELAYFYVITALLFVICIHTAVANSLLIYRRQPKEFWSSDNERYFLICCLSSNVISSVFQIIRIICSNVFHHINIGFDFLSIILITIIDWSVLSTVFLFSALSLRNTWMIRRFFLRQQPSTKIFDHRWASILSCLSCVLLAGLFTSVGFGLHIENPIFPILPHTATHICRLIIVISLQLALCFSLIKSKRMCALLQKQFVSKQAQQTLSMRVTRRRILECTNLMLPLVVAHVILWMTLICADFFVDWMLDVNSVPPINQFDQSNASSTIVEETDLGCFGSIWSALFDTVVLAYCALFPIILARRIGEKFRIRFWRAFCFGFWMKEEMTENNNANAVFTSTVSPLMISDRDRDGTKLNEIAAAHINAIETQWCIAKPVSNKNDKL